LALVLLGVVSASAVTLFSGAVTRDRLKTAARVTPMAFAELHPRGAPVYKSARLPQRQRPRVHAAVSAGGRVNARPVAARHTIPATSSHRLPVRSSVEVIPARRPVRHSVPPVSSSALVSAAVLAPITVSEDAYVQSDVPSANFGTASTLNNVSGTPEARAYLKFNVTGVSGTITKATFRVFTQTSSGSGYELHAVSDNAWTEAGLNYANRPAVGALVGTAVNFTGNTWTSVDVTSVVKNNGTFSFEMNAVSTSLKKYASKESGANAPQLVLETSAPASQPSAVAATAGSGQTATVGTTFTTNLAVKVTDASAQPVQGATVTFTAPSSGPSGSFGAAGATATAVSGSDGVATAPQLTANTAAGSFSVSASVAGVATPATFVLTNAAATGPTTITIVPMADGYVESDLPSTNFGTSVVLKNTTTPDTRAYLKFDLSGISGTVTQATFRAFTQTSSGSGYELHQVTDNSWVEPGLTYSNRPAVGTLVGSAVNFTANTWTSVDVSSVVKAAGTFSFEMNGTSTSLKQYSSKEGANPPQLVVSYTPTVTPSALSVVGGNDQTATVGTAFASKLAVKATDTAGNPVAGAVIRFSAPTSGAGAAFAGGSVTVSATTGSDGVATTPQLVANATAGTYQVSATTTGVANPVTFSLTNTPAPPPSTPTAVDVADAYVRSDVPASNFGTSSVLIGRTSPEIDSYIKFDVSGLSGAPLRALLRLWVETTGATTYKVYQVSDNSWTEDGLVFTNKPAFGGLVATSGATTAGTWVDLDVTGAVAGNGFVTLGFTAGSTAGKNFGSREDAAHAPQLLLTAQAPANGDPVIVAAGDIACSPADANFNGGAGTATACHEQATSDLVLSLDPIAVITLGDEQYNSGKLTDFLTSYDPTWGRFKAITHPSIGNHELGTTGASGYFNYFGDNATPLQPGCRSNCNAWYSYSIANWRIITLNTECGSNGNNCVAGSAQDIWLKSELASANAAGQCKLVTSHHPKWSSSSFAATDIDQLVQDMYDAHIDIYLTGHMHGYERFAPQNPAGQLDATNGITEIISGAGGAFFTGFLAIQPHSVVHNNDTYGVLKLILRPHSADYQFVRDPTSGLFSDSGTVTCH
jgi:Calcineurin-like phosphoesterase